MNNEQLRNDLIDAAQSHRFDELMTLIDEHQPDLKQEAFIFRAGDGTVLNSVAHVLMSYVANFCPCADVQKVMALGGCPNSNNKSATELTLQVRTQAGMPFVALDKHYAESRPLINAIKQGKREMVELLINYPCPCCNGQGARITPLIQELADEHKDKHPDSLAIVNDLAEKLAA